MRADYHVHCEFSDDSRELMEHQIERGIEIGLDELCFTDHVDYGIKKDWDEGDIEWRGGDGIGTAKDELEPLVNVNYPEYFSKIDRMRVLYGKKITVRKGLEFGIQTITADQYEKLFAKYLRNTKTSWTSCCSRCMKWKTRNSGRRTSRKDAPRRNTTTDTTKRSMTR